VLYFATHYLDTRTRRDDHRQPQPADYNGFKVVLAGATIHGEEIQEIRRMIETGDLAEGEGSERTQLRRRYPLQRGDRRPVSLRRR
jgi:phosphomannomutase / phosphoglucomutase